jgi:TPR repeat protein
MRRTISALLVSMALLAGAASAASSEDLDTAQAFLDAGLYAEAEDPLRAAADQGDARAAEILGFLYSYGEEAFPGVAQDPAAAARWFEVAARGGDPVARYMTCALARAGSSRTARDCVNAAGTP